MRIAITGSSGFIGRALAAALRARVPGAHLIGLDRRSPPAEIELDRHVYWEMRAPLAPFLRAEGIDHLAHLAFQVDPLRNERAMAAINVGGTRHVLDEAQAAGIAHITMLSSATAYGAHPDNPPLLSESAPLRATGGFSYARHKALVEADIAVRRGAFPETSFLMVRPTAVVGPGLDNYLRALLDKPRIADPRPGAPPFQLVDVDDLAAIVAKAMEIGMEGVLNVAAPGLVTLDDVAELTGARLVPIDRRLMRGITAAAWRLGMRSITPAPPEILDYVVHPWVIDTTRLERTLAPAWRCDARAALARMVTDRD